MTVLSRSPTRARPGPACRSAAQIDEGVGEHEPGFGDSILHWTRFWGLYVCHPRPLSSCELDEHDCMRRWCLPLVAVLRMALRARTSGGTADVLLGQWAEAVDLADHMLACRNDEEGIGNTVF